MTERLYIDRPDVYVLADCDAREGGHARLVVCEHPDGAEYAELLAASLGVPIRYETEPGEQDPAPPPTPARPRVRRHRLAASAAIGRKPR
jgi:hypothetical protein